MLNRRNKQKVPAMTRQIPPPGQRTPQGQPKAHPRAEQIQVQITPTWRIGDRVRWTGRLGFFRRDLDDGIHAEIRIEQRRYRVRLADLSPG
jgi:hypothetical protein